MAVCENPEQRKNHIEQPVPDFAYHPRVAVLLPDPGDRQAARVHRCNEGQDKKFPHAGGSRLDCHLIGPAAGYLLNARVNACLT